MKSLKQHLIHRQSLGSACLFVFKFYIGVKLIYNVMLVSGVQHSNLYIVVSLC